MSNATAVFFPAVLALVIVGAFIQLYRVRGKVAPRTGILSAAKRGRRCG